MPPVNYFNFIIQNWRFLVFGIVLNLFSSAGQTYFISVFGGEFRRDFSLSDGEFGFIYMVATVTSAASLIWLGRFIDRIDLRIYAALVCAGIVAAILFTSIVETAFMLGVAFYFLRLMGQGLMNHTAITSMGRYFTERRGTAIGFISLGNTIGIAIYPVMGVVLIAWLGWSESWALLGGVYAIVLVPLVLWLLKGHKVRHENYLIKQHKESSLRGPSSGDYTVRSMIRELRFYLILPATLAPSFLLTGVIFHQVRIVEAKEWSMSIFASGFTGLAIATFLTSLALGPLVDKWRAVNILPFILVPLAVALVVLNMFQAEIFSFVFLIFMGCSWGAAFAVSGAIWPELYGTTHLGAIKSFTKALNVFASALSPWVFGLLFDAKFGILEISYLSIGIIFVTGLLAKISQYTHSQEPLKKAS
ncbi:MAG: MFS transporter [Rhodospirillales bacterium]|nr:MFS transporter [Rhodospirillaceae bacterium]MBT5034173.1 MFS transporter [Rhodospirillaceae bacterium]MBT6219154.1 MFS transporter [Rhodospirillaceae bacterium]MBT7769406.1 MFS transporter [Rhodospirillales bacterium]MBT8003484.1 MFS transporter [Rhodospirillales bacterium]